MTNQALQIPTLLTRDDHDLDVSYEPGSIRPTYLCPYCSKMYLHTDENDQLADIPYNCRRCGAPMSYENTHKEGGFADQIAMEEAKALPVRRQRDKMVKTPTKAKVEGDS